MRITDKICADSRKGQGRSFVNGVLLLSASTLICKVIGLLFKIPIIRIVGIEGMAYFSSAYNVYMLLNSIAAAGLPVALSIMISKNVTQGNRVNVKKIFRVSMLLFVAIGLLGTLLLLFGADLYSDAIGIHDSAAAVKTIAPTVLFITVSGGLRGYFQGHEFMAPTAVSQLIESLGKLILGMGLALLAIQKGMDVPHIAASAVCGLSLGVLLSVIYLLIRYVVWQRKHYENAEMSTRYVTESKRRIVGDLLWIALPVTLSSCLTSITSLADTALITNGLVESGYAKDTAVALYSSYTNLVIPLFNFVPALVTPLAVSLIPTITASITRREREETCRLYSSAVKLCLAFSVPAAAGMAVFSYQILNLIYPSEAEACALSAPMLSLLSVAIVFSCLTTVFNAVLQAYMKTAYPIVSMAVGAGIKIILEYVLVRAQIGILGAPLSTVVGCFAIMCMNIVFVIRLTPHKFEVLPLFKALAATAICIIMAVVTDLLLNKAGLAFQYSLISAIFVACVVYAFASLKCDVIGADEIGNLPMGDRIVAFLRKLKLIK